MTRVDLDEVADRLYALPPQEFTPSRAEAVKAAKESGDAALAKRIGALRKPTVSAWAVNRAAREHAAELADLLTLGEDLRAAWQAHDADALAELTRRRADLTGRLTRLLRPGLSAAAAAEVAQTLDAAVVDADAAERVRQGRLAKPLSYTGFAPAPVVAPVRRKKPVEDEARERAEADARRARELAEAETAHQEWRDALTQALEVRDALAEKAAKLAKKLTKARKRLAEADQRVDVTRREERHAAQRLSRLA
ncbi:hypothetical protein OIE66_14595 [Nonomuraea sp. NBC_01738]|uniref:hypothetical protein n=1 Tax=Nonomuraea sp. NBC_01738 TaxID=2976003 RepID=UPI002E0D15E5|nr:hypothetical protein OIE66_14595 [Nonomuraea sp. NBC_01738]